MRSLADNPVLRWVIVFALLFAVLLGAQAVGAATAPPGGVTSTGRLLGQTSFAYLGGLRTFAAAMLWNSIDPEFHEYESVHKTLDETYIVFLPTVHLVLALDPRFEQGYYTASFFLARMGHVDKGVALAQDGIRNIPTSGLLRSNYIQLLRMQDKVGNRPEMLRQAKLGLAPTIQFANVDDEFEALGVFRSVFTEIGDTATAAAIKSRQLVLKSQGARPRTDRSTTAPASATGK